MEVEHNEEYLVVLGVHEAWNAIPAQQSRDVSIWEVEKSNVRVTRVTHDLLISREKSLTHAPNTIAVIEIFGATYLFVMRVRLPAKSHRKMKQK